jgi:uncharacterized protein (TIGR00255 family)
MTGFARFSGSRSGLAWAWEARSVNGKGLDVRLRLPPGFERLEQPVRTLANGAFKRGSLQINLQLSGGESGQSVRINEALLQQLADVAERHRNLRGGPAVDISHLLSVKGVVEIVEEDPAEDEIEAIDQMLLKGLEQALTELAQSRRTEGARLASVLHEQVNRIESLTDAARNNPSRQPAVIQQRLAEQVQRLANTAAGLDPQRLHQEAVLLATKADIQEEIDRLHSHIVAARALLEASEPVGRKFDFLVQEFNREANTLCSKSTDSALTAVGLELKTVIDQMREQAQNIE